MLNPFVIGGLILGGYWLLGAGRTAVNAGKLRASISGIQWGGVHNMALELGIILSIDNPSNQTLYIENTDLLISLDTGKTLATFKRSFGKEYEIRPQSVTRHTFNLRTNLVQLALTLGPAVVDFLKNGNLPKELKVEGTITINGVPFPYNESYPLSKGEEVKGLGIAVPTWLTGRMYVPKSSLQPA